MPFQKGNKLAEGNDKTLNIKTWLNKELHTTDPETLDEYGKAVDKVQKLAKFMVKNALSTSDKKLALEYIKEILDRVEGKPKQSTEITGKDGGPIEFANYSDEDLKKIINGIE